MSEVSLLPTDGHIVAGVSLDNGRFLGRMRASQLLQVTIDPRRTEDLRQLEGNTQLQNVRQIRMEVQRLFQGAKAKNVEPYAHYIVRVHDGNNGMAPPIILYSEKALPVDDNPSRQGQIQIPYGVLLVAIDGETQLAARFEAASINEETQNEFVPVMICHGCPIAWARQVFHDLNMLAVRPNAALGLSMDERDHLTHIARFVEENVPFFKGRVNFKRRQLGNKDKEVLTFTALRGACVTLAEGIGGVKYGARPVPISRDRVEGIRSGAVLWFTELANMIGPAMENRSNTVACSSSVMAALGAAGHEIVETPEARRNVVCQRLIDKIRLVRWDKGELWDGIAGKMGVKGNFSTSGAKDASYLVYSALIDETSSGYRQVRGGGQAKVLAAAAIEDNRLREERELAPAGT